ncbi:MAG: HTTM domain-containing protein [Saprospiraceae bacterium]|nr:HTTM domain-containing protein [Saprospiraceae bacterium]
MKPFSPVDIASLAFFRAVFGILGFADLMGVWAYYHLSEGYFQPENFQFKYMGFEWARPLPEPFMSIVFLGLMVVALLIAVGRWYRVCTVVFFFGFSYVFLLEKALYLNHGYLFCWLSFLMIFLPADRNFSWDVLRNPALRSNEIQAWSLYLLPLMMGIVYVYGAIAKLNADWLLEANPLHDWLKRRGDMPLLGWLWEQKPTAYFMAWSGFLLDLTAPFFLLLRKTRAWALGFVLLFHFTNTLLFQIGVFPWLSIALSLLYFPPDWPRQVWAFAKQKMRWPQRVENWWENRLNTAANVGEAWSLANIVPPAYPPKAVKLALTAILAFHLLMPLRHWLFPGDVAWTEEGHRFSWRMMLRSKQGYGHFVVKDLKTGEETNVKVADYLTSRQQEKIFTHPDMVLQFAHYLRDLWHRRGVAEVAVYGSIRASLNGGHSQPFIDAEVDLAKVEWEPFRASDWVITMEGD